MQYITNSEQETKKLAENLAKNLRLHPRGAKLNIIALTGELGAGKTTFVQGFAKGLGIKEKIISPTFILIRQHKIPKHKKMLFHIDLYRLEDEKQIKDLGLKDLLNDTNHLIVIEWAEKAKRLLPKNTFWIKFENIGGNKRKINIS